MKRLALALLLCLALALPGQAQTIKKPNQDSQVNEQGSGLSFLQKRIAAIFGVYSIKDEFTTTPTDTAVADIGAYENAKHTINGTAAEPGPGTRTVVDTNGVLSIANGYLQKSGAGVNATDPRDVYGAITRAVGKIFISSVNLNNISEACFIGPGSVNTGAGGKATFYLNGTGPVINIVEPTSGSNLAVGSFSLNTDQLLASILRATGAMWFAKNSGNWVLLFVSSNDNTATLYPAIRNSGVGANIWKVAFFREPVISWLPTPLVSDGFSSWGTSDGLGHAETTGLGSGGAGLAWTTRAGTIGVAAGKAVASALNGDRAISTVPVVYLNQYIKAALTKGTTGCGVILRYKDLDNYIYYWHDGTNAKVIKRVGGVDQAAVVSTAVAYSAGANIHAIINGTSSTEFYNNAAAGGAKTINDADLQTGKTVGIIFFDTDSTIDNFVGYPAGGSEGSLNILDIFSVG